MRRICKSNQSKGSSTHNSASCNQPHSLPCVLVSEVNVAKSTNLQSKHPSSHVSEANKSNYFTSARMNRKRIDQMTDQEVKQLIRITIERRKLSRNLHEKSHSNSQQNLSCNRNSPCNSKNTATQGDTLMSDFNDHKSSPKKNHTHALPGEPMNKSSSSTSNKLNNQITKNCEPNCEHHKPTSEANACCSCSSLSCTSSPVNHPDESWSLLNHFNHSNPPKSKIEIGQKTNGLTTRTTKSSTVDPTEQFEQLQSPTPTALADGISNCKNINPNLVLKDTINFNCKQSNIESSLDSSGTNNNLSNQVKQSTNHWPNSTSTAVNNNLTAARSNSPSLEQLMEYHRTSGVTVRPKIWPRVRKEPLFAPLWETQSARDSPTSDSIMKSPGPTTTISSMANGSSPSPILSSPSPSSCLLADGSVLTPNSATASATAAAVATSVTSSSSVTSVSAHSQPSHLHGPGSEMPDRATNCMSMSGDSTNSNGGTCVTSPTTPSSSPSLELNSPTASGHVLFTCGDANSNSNSTRSSIYIRSEPKLTSDQKISSTHLSDRSRRLNHRRSNIAAAIASTELCTSSPAVDPSASLDMTHQIEKLNLNPSDGSNGIVSSHNPDIGQIINGHCESSTSTSSTSSTRNGPVASLNLDKCTPRNSYLDDGTSGPLVDGKLPPKPPTSNTNGNEETVRERIHRKSFYQRFNDDSGHNSPRFKSASPARRRSSFLEGDDFVQVNANGSGFMRRCFSHNPSPSPTPGHRPSYNQSISMIDRKESSSNSDWFSRMEAKANQMLSDMKSQITDGAGGVKLDITANGHCNSDITRRRSTSLLRNAGKNVTNSRPNSSYYAALGDSDSDDEELIPTTSRGKSYSRKTSFLNGPPSAGASSTGGVGDVLHHHQINSAFK